MTLMINIMYFILHYTHCNNTTNDVENDDQNSCRSTVYAFVTVHHAHYCLSGRICDYLLFYSILL